MKLLGIKYLIQLEGKFNSIPMSPGSTYPGRYSYNDRTVWFLKENSMGFKSSYATDPEQEEEENA